MLRYFGRRIATPTPMRTRLLSRTRPLALRSPLVTALNSRPLHVRTPIFTAPTAKLSTTRTASAAAATSNPSTNSIPAPTTAALDPLPFKLGELAGDGSGFRCVDISKFDDFHLTVYTFEHSASGTKFVHLSRADADNAFCISLRTPPADSTGIAHILEHTTLCGSEKYPVSDPFFLLTRRSLKTFMNAMTGQDHTLYPFSTQNRTDYTNLLNVYCDAVFFPHLRETDFATEAHRLEFEQPKSTTTTDSKSDAEPKPTLIRKGVVLNEMKGAMSEAGAIFSQRLSVCHSSLPAIALFFCFCYGLGICLCVV